MGKKKKVTIGHRYLMGIQAGLCCELDEIVEWQAGNKTVWQGSITNNTEIYIDRPKLFGGDEQEGGIQGTLAVLFGTADQPVHTRLAAMLGGTVPAFRGAVTAYFDGMICAMTKYPKQWGWRVRRSVRWNGATAWYAEKAMIPMAGGAIKAMNPAHIIYQLYTDRRYRNLPPSRLDDASFRAAADQLYKEGFGLCLKWVRQDSINNFVQTVLDHIGAARYTNRRTGRIELKLIRADYNVDDLPLFTPDTGLLGLDDDESGSQSKGINQVIVKYRDPIARKERSVRVRSTAGIHSSGSVNSLTVDYFGVSTAELAVRLGQRDMQANSGFVKRFTVRLDRRGNDIHPGHVFRISDPARGIENMVLRAGRIDNGKLTEGTNTIEALQDVFGLPATSYVQFNPPGYVPPDTTPKVVTSWAIFEAPYREIAQVLGSANAQALASTSGYLFTYAAAPNSLSLSYDLMTRVSGNYIKRDDGAFTPTAILNAEMTPSTTSVSVVGAVNLEDVAVGTAALIDNEIVRVDAINLTTGVLTLGRGCVDTVPVSHTAGSTVWFFDDFSGIDQTEYTTNVTAYAKLLTVTSAGTLAEASATQGSIRFTGRAARPYPPGQVKINGQYWPDREVGSLALTWAHRDRVLQADQLVDFTAGSMGPESGTTYSYRLLRADTSAVLTSGSAVAGTSVTIPTTYSGLVNLEVWAVRNAQESHQRFKHTFDLVQPITLIGTTVPDFLTAIQQDVVVPAAVTAGDLLLAWVMHQEDVTPPTGWTLAKAAGPFSAQGSAQRVSAFYKVAGAADAGLTEPWLFAGDPQRTAVHLMAFRGDRPLGVLSGSTSIKDGNGTGQHTTPSITPTTAGQIAVSCCSFVLVSATGTSTMSASSGWTLTTPTTSSDPDKPIRMGCAWRSLTVGQAVTSTFMTNTTTSVNGTGGVVLLVGRV